MKRILVSALEPSANLHLEEVLNQLKKQNEEFQIVGIFDSSFAKPIYDSKEFSAMGFVEVLPLIFKAKKAIKEMVELSKTCDSVLLIDSPAFNLPLAKEIKKAKSLAKITYYILPQVWAWKAKRVEKVQKYCDNLASILPFDSLYYSKSKYVGHPLLDEIDIKYNGQNSGKIAFLPGSRKSEIKRLMPVYKEIAKNLKNKTKILVVPNNLKNDLEVYGDINEFEISYNTHESLQKCEFAFICSGTATLEAAIIGIPFVLCYKAKSIDIFIARCFVKLKHIGLANIMFDFMGKSELNKEFIQDDVNCENLLNAYENYDMLSFKKASDELKAYLKHGSAKNVAEILIDGKVENE